MSQLDPTATTALDICTAALSDAGLIGLGQPTSPAMLGEAQARLQWLLQEWERKSWLVYANASYGIATTGATSYSVGPGGAIDTGVGSVRPAQLETAFLRLNAIGAPVDYPLEAINSRDRYNEVTLKALVSFTQAVYYEPQWPLGMLYPLPIASAGQGYELHVTFRNQLPASFAADGSTVLSLPYEYYRALVLNLAVEVRRRYRMPTYDGDPLVAQAREAMNVLRTTNYQMAPAKMPAGLGLRRGGYNIFGDTYGN